MTCSTRWTLPVAAALLVAMALPLVAPAAVNVGDRPTISFTSVQGPQVTSESLAGKLVIVDFWATWCGPCIASMPEIIEIDRAYGDKGVQLIGVSLDTNKQSMLSFISARGMKWPQAFDGRGWETAMASAWGVNSIPRTFLISPEGEVLWSGHPARLRPAFEEALRNHPPRPAEPQVSEETVAAAKAAVSAARDALSSGDYRAFLDAVASVPDEAVEDRRLRGPAMVLAHRLRLLQDDAALSNFREANPEAAAKLERLIAAFAREPLPQGVQPAPLADAGRAAERRLEQAEKLHEAGDRVAAYKGLSWIVDRAGDTDAAVTAAQRLAEYEADPAILAEIRAADAEAKARSAFGMARNYEAAGRVDLAKESYRQLVKDHPGTPAAAEAQARLDALR